MNTNIQNNQASEQATHPYQYIKIYNTITNFESMNAEDIGNYLNQDKVKTMFMKKMEELFPPVENNPQTTLQQFNLTHFDNQKYAITPHVVEFLSNTAKILKLSV